LKGTSIVSGRTHNPKVYGHIPGIQVGKTWRSREDCSRDAVHGPLRAGIHGTAEDGAYSIVMSGGYEDDDDNGDVFIYSGQGGRDYSTDKLSKTRGKGKHWAAPQSTDQDWTRGNRALQVSSQTKKPVRVVRGRLSNGTTSRYAPPEGYRYDGLYKVTKAWQETGKKGHMMCKFRLERLPNQDPLVLTSYESDEEMEEIDDSDESVEESKRPTRSTGKASVSRPAAGSRKRDIRPSSSSRSIKKRETQPPSLNKTIIYAKDYTKGFPKVERLEIDESRLPELSLPTQSSSKTAVMKSLGI